MLRIWSLVLLVVLFTACTRIEPGSVGIKVDLVGTDRNVDNIEVVVGRVTYNPLTTEIVRFPTTATRYEWYGEDALRFTSTEGVTLWPDISISLSVIPDEAPELYTKYRKTLDELIDNEVRDRVNGCLNRVASTMTVDEILGEGRNEFSDRSTQCIGETLESEGLRLHALNLTSDFRPPENIQARINEQIEAQQAAVAAENRVRQVEAEAAQRRAQAQGEADARRIAAQAEAEALRIQGEALRENPEVLQLNFLEKWNGVLPTVMGSGSEGISLILPQLPGQ